MEQLNDLLNTLVSSSSYELRLEPNKTPYLVSTKGETDASPEPLLGSQISNMIFPIIPDPVKLQLPSKDEVQFTHPHNLGTFTFTVTKSRTGLNVTIAPVGVAPNVPSNSLPFDPIPQTTGNTAPLAGVTHVPAISKPAEPLATLPKMNMADLDQMSHSLPVNAKPRSTGDSLSAPKTQVESAAPAAEPAPQPASVTPPAVKFSGDPATARMDALFHAMATAGASDLHMSVSMPPMVRLDGKMKPLDCGEGKFDQSAMKEILHSIMPEKNKEEFDRRHDTDFAYEIPGLARFRCNVFMDRKGMGAVFRIIPTKILTAEQLGLSKAIMDLCSLSKGLVVVTGPTGSGKSTTLCAMVDSINKTREDHIITIEDPIEFVHDNQKCLVNQREVHNHTDSFKDALRAALREDPDILLVGEMRDLETISIAIETAETGHLVFGTLHTTTAASTVDRIIDQFPADRQQQIRVMLSESLKGVIAQTLLPKKGGGRVAALEVLIVTPAISNLIREGKTFQIPSAMQTGKNNGMVMLNDALFEHVKNGLVEPKDAYIKAVDKAGFETMLTRGGFKL